MLRLVEVSKMLMLRQAQKPVVTVDVTATLAETARTMAEHNVGTVVVLEGERLAGIVTDRDITVRAVARGVVPDGRVGDVMTSGVVTVDIGASFDDALKILRTHAFRRIPVTEYGRPVGMLSTDDILVSLAGDLADLTRPVVGEVVFGRAEAAELAAS